MKIEKKYCVIGKSVRENREIPRTWKETVDEAASHAEELIRGMGKDAVIELYVVEIKRVVRTAAPPITQEDVE